MMIGVKALADTGASCRVGMEVAGQRVTRSFGQVGESYLFERDAVLGRGLVPCIQSRAKTPRRGQRVTWVLTCYINAGLFLEVLNGKE
jgi:hypothetical protein